MWLLSNFSKLKILTEILTSCLSWDSLEISSRDSLEKHMRIKKGAIKCNSIEILVRQLRDSNEYSQLRFSREISVNNLMRLSRDSQMWLLSNFSKLKTLTEILTSCLRWDSREKSSRDSL